MTLCETQEFRDWVDRATVEFLCEWALTFRETRMVDLSSAFCDAQIQALERSSRLATTNLLARFCNSHGE